jgi:hypothetical protein
VKLHHHFFLRDDLLVFLCVLVRAFTFVAAASLFAQYAFIRRPTARRAEAGMRRLRREEVGVLLVGDVAGASPSSAACRAAI